MDLSQLEVKIKENEKPEFNYNKAYSGFFKNDTSSGGVYGPNGVYRLKELGDVGIEHPALINGKEYVCEGNRALAYNVDDTYYGRNLM